MIKLSSLIKELFAKKSIHSLSMKLIMGIGGLICVGSLSFWYTNIHTVEEETLKNTITHTNTYINLIKRSSYNSMLLNNVSAIQEMFESMTSDEGITHIRVFDLKGKIFFSSERNEVGTQLPNDSPTCTICHDTFKNAPSPLKISQDSLTTPQWMMVKTGESRAIKSVLPVFNESSCSSSSCHYHDKSQKILGVLEADFSLKSIDEQITQRKVATASFGIIFTVFASVILCIILWIIVISPLLKLTDGMRYVSRGDLDTRIDIQRKDEIGILANTFNAMTKEIKISREKLENWAKELEEEVAKKTEEIKRGQEQYIHTEKLASLGRMAAGVAHEINSPLTGIVTFAHLMLKRLPPDNKMDREDLEVIVEQAERCSKIIKGLLGFSRAIPAEKNEMNTNETIQHAVGMIHNQAKFHNVNIKLDLDFNIPIVAADASQIEQVFLNLLINAADAMNDKGSITIRTGETTIDGNRYVEVEFTDTGPGIPEEHISRLFEPFFTTKPVGKGTGLGLAVSHGIIRKHGGHIIVKSLPGEGASFFVRLPMQTASFEEGDDGKTEQGA